jgi:hypothetical protein
MAPRQIPVMTIVPSQEVFMEEAKGQLLDREWKSIIRVAPPFLFGL